MPNRPFHIFTKVQAMQAKGCVFQFPFRLWSSYFTSRWRCVLLGQFVSLFPLTRHAFQCLNSFSSVGHTVYFFC